MTVIFQKVKCCLKRKLARPQPKKDDFCILNLPNEDYVWALFGQMVGISISMIFIRPSWTLWVWTVDRFYSRATESYGRKRMS